MTVFAASLKAGVKIVPLSLGVAVAYREVTQSPITAQTIAVSFAGIVALALVGAIVTTRDTANASAAKLDGILARLTKMETHYEDVARLVQIHEGTLGQHHFPQRDDR